MTNYAKMTKAELIKKAGALKLSLDALQVLVDEDECDAEDMAGQLAAARVGANDFAERLGRAEQRIDKLLIALVAASK